MLEYGNVLIVFSLVFPSCRETLGADYFSFLLALTRSYYLSGIKPVFVFDGSAPALKSGELAKRRKRLEEAKIELDKAKEAGKQAVALASFALNSICFVC